ncbi:hypothetical protein H5410_030830 [Solanum commersonii]|uniref:PUM-HD domain-containing protein n=1 Tax=Solanum commersonii TaxID=4109 RepID=A0A9J5YJV8_SOLCO|nr:hypothetical protein H5410_030830 [Solanum commersonii]
MQPDLFLGKLNNTLKVKSFKKATVEKGVDRGSLIGKCQIWLTWRSCVASGKFFLNSCGSLCDLHEHEYLVCMVWGKEVMMNDQFANYVVQKVLENCDDQQLELILNRIKVHLNALKKYTYGKHIVARVEKLVAAGERRISFLASYYT